VPVTTPQQIQYLVDEVTQNVKEIKTTDFEKAKKAGLVEYVGKDVDEAYWDTVCSVSLSKERDLKIVYSPLHGTGLSSTYPILKRLKFDVSLDPKTSNMSGAFENVMFNIPNPEVIESFNVSLPFAKSINADILISTDPDADRFGVMVNHKDSWKFLNGNEIGVILAQYGVNKYKSSGKLNKECILIKTAVTTSLIEKIAHKNGIECIGDLLVGFKYIANEMQKLENEGKIQNFILGMEESHGFIIKNYSHDKDAACAAVWISELAAELKKEGKTLVDYLDEIYSTYGYCHNYLTEVRLTGSKGMEQIALLMKTLRNEKIDSFGKFGICKKIDRWDGEAHLSATDTASRDVLVFNLNNVEGTQDIKITVRPSGTEPKVKMYFELSGKAFDLKNIDEEKKRIVDITDDLEKDLMQHCYKILDVDFPRRGFLLFWQLPLNEKLKYFEIEGNITALKEIQDKKEKKENLFKLLEFLGANPVEKVDKAFIDKYKVGMLDYLSL